MLRKAVIGLILSAMVMHCAVRIGLVSYLYEQRYEIAFALGFIDEVPITQCGHQYLAEVDFYIDVPQDVNDLSLPQAAHVQEIHLFLDATPAIGFPADRGSLQVVHSSRVVSSGYPSPHSGIFHPPC